MPKFRYTLRRKKKIAESLGEDYLALLVKSLDKYFKENSTHGTNTIKEEEAEGYNMIFVPSAFERSEIDFQFAIIKKTYNVYNLSYYSAIG